MAFQALNSNVSRLTQRLTENFKESTRDMPMLHGGAGASSVYFEAPSDERLKEMGKMLDSRVETERLEGMKRLIAMISKGRDMSAFFPQVVKNVATPSVEIRKLVYIYLLRYASTNPDLLLLSINTFQKDLSDPSPLIRTMSLRVLTSIRLPMIQGLVMIGLRKLAGDRNGWVRKSVAGGLGKVYDMDTTTLPLLLPILSQLLSLPSPITLGSSLQAFLLICPDNLAFLHPHFRKICLLLGDADEWGQIVALEAMMRYGRVMLEKPEFAGNVNAEDVRRIKAERKVKKTVELNGKEGEDKDDDDDEQKDEKHIDDEEEEEEEDDLDPDLHLLLHCTLPLFQSRNPAVVLAAAKLFWELAPADHEEVGQERFVLPLLRLVDGLVREEISGVVVDVCKEMIVERPWLFFNYFTRFLPRSTDSISTTLTKIHILRMLVVPSNAEILIKEFKEYVRSPVREISEEAIKAVGFCARTQEGVKMVGMGILMKLLKSNRESSVGQAVIVLKSLIQKSVEDGTTDVARQLTSKLVRQLPSITHSSARACVFWLAGQYAEQDGTIQSNFADFSGLAPWTPDTLRLGVKSFKQETSSTKLQILSLAAKLLTICPTAKPLVLLSQYVFTLARYDEDWDVRDRSRFLNALLRGVRRTVQAPTGVTEGEGPDGEEDVGGVVLRREQVKSVLLGVRHIAVDQSDDFAGPSSGALDVATLSALAGKRLQGYEALPDWSEDPTDSSLRDVEEEHRKIPVSPSAQQPFLSRNSSFQPTGNSSLSPASPSPTLPAMSESPNLAGLTKGKQAKFKDLDAFLDESDEDEEDEDQDEEEEEEEEESSEEESSDEDEPFVPAKARYEPPRRQLG